MTDRPYLVDTSVVGRSSQAKVAERLVPLNQRRLVWTCRVIDLEVIYATRAREVKDVAEERKALFAVPIDETVLDRAIDVAALMADFGTHRGAGPADLVIAAAAEAAGLAILHYDHDFERIAEVTGQPTEWIAPPGTLD